ncbi:MAG: hypothetical protein H0T99_03375 [Geodermatophilaceae bacterium]|nr:hypothetical protein [Geodermatophilaceae bacterium]
MLQTERDLVHFGNLEPGRTDRGQGVPVRVATPGYARPERNDEILRTANPPTAGSDVFVEA